MKYSVDIVSLRPKSRVANAIGMFFVFLDSIKGLGFYARLK